MWYYRALHRHIENALVQADLDASAAMLDAGCGTGGLIRRFEHHHPGWRWTGVDFEPLACSLARGRCSGEIVEASVTSLPFADATFDAVVSADVICNIADDDVALSEFCRVLRPGGLLVINVPAHRWLWSYHDVAVHARRRYNRRGVGARLDASGLKRLRVTHWNTLPLPLVFVRRKFLPPPRCGSDVRLYPRAVESMFSALMAVERNWLRRIGNLPLGSSILASAVKPQPGG